MPEHRLWESESEPEKQDPDATPIAQRKLITQPYDLVVGGLVDQIKGETLHLKPLSDRPGFQRRYVWPPKLASRLIESMLLNVPIPPCYLAQSPDFQLDVIDGQQRIYSIYRYLENQFALGNLEVLKELNGKHFFELPLVLQRKLKTHTLRCVIITNDSDPEIKFDVFERLNTNTTPLNAQELRNCIYRGDFMRLIESLAEGDAWLSILGRKTVDKRMRGEEMVLRFFAFKIAGLQSYKTPLKHWLNDVADNARGYTAAELHEHRLSWDTALERCTAVFAPSECFRRIDAGGKKSVVNRALMDLTMSTATSEKGQLMAPARSAFRDAYATLLAQEEFDDLISRSVDHKKRTLRRFELWRDQVEAVL